jgi:predicted acyltransferase (DUF342 family)
MAQIIKHRRGSIGDVKTTTTRNGELLIASGSISDLSGPFVFIGSPASTDEGVAGAFKPTSKVYTGTNAPSIAAGTYGSILDGTPFYATGNESLYILNNDSVGNSRIDLTGNIEGNTIANVTITSLTGSNANVTNVTGGTLTVTGNQTIGGTLGVTGNTSVGGNINVTGNITGSNLRLSGNADIDGNINLGGNITVGDATTDFIKFGADVSSSIIPDVNNAFDLGSTSQAWKDLYVNGTAYIQGLSIESDIELTNLALPGNLTVSGTTNLLGDVIIGDGTTDTLTINGSTIDVPNIQAGTDNSVVVYNGTSLVTDEIDSRVWGDTLLDNNGTALTANRVPFVLDGVSLQDDADFTYNGTTNTLSVGTSTISNNVVVGNNLTVTTNAEIKGNAGVTGDLNVTGSVGIDTNLDVEGNVNITGTTNISGSTVIDDTLTVTGTSDLQSDANVHGQLTVTGNTNLQANLYVSGNLEVLGSTTNVTIQSQTVEIDDNIIRLNSYSPFERYAGFEVMDSGSSGVSASLVWDSQNDHWMFVSSSGESSKLIGTTAGAYGSETSLAENFIPKGTGKNTIGDSLLKDDSTTLSYNTNKFTVASTDGATLIAGNVTLSANGGADAGSNTSAIVFRNSSNVLGYVSTTESTDVLDGILGYKASDGALVFSTVIDGGTY